MAPFRDLLTNWNTTFARLRPDFAIPGSPERCFERHVVEDEDGTLWLLERLGPGQAIRREAIGQLLDALNQRGLFGLAPYRRTASGSFVCREHGASWQLSPFILGEPLVQPNYLDDSAKGDSLGSWMAAFRTASGGLPVPSGLFGLDLPAYITDLLARIGRVSRDGTRGSGPKPTHHAPSDDAGSRIPPSPGMDLAQVHVRAAHLLPSLAEFFAAYDALPRALCHGDIHPLNAVWGKSEVLAVIDWEFAGKRPEIYDLANCLGCLAIEGDRGFESPFALALLARTLHAGLYSPLSARMLLPAILATRFGWLSEWLRRKDEEMLQLELDLMEHLAARM